MHWIIVLGIIAFLLYALTRSKGSTGNTSRKSSGGGGGHGTNFLPPIPNGFQIFEGRLSVMGIQHRRDDGQRFADGSEQTLALECEPDNPHDKNAIRVVGMSRGKHFFIGYVAKEIAEQIVGSNLAESVQPRLERIWRGGDGYVEVAFQIIGPKDKKEQYDGWAKNQPADASQKEFLKFFGLSVPKGLTTGQADTLITEHRRKLEAEDKATLDEWDAYTEICDEFDDPDFRSSWNLKKVSRSLLKEALDDLNKKNGATLRSLADNIDKVVEKVVALKPDIEKQ